MTFDDYLAEQMRDPAYRFWNVVLWPRMALLNAWLAFVLWLRSAPRAG
jgi:hypothetical protein